MDLSNRKQTLLMTLVERHIRDGQPVGSKAIANSGALSVSPATIRNLMAELERMGVLASPHTSAGRVPTELGYRLYVDALLKTSIKNADDIIPLQQDLHQLIQPDQSPEEIYNRASRALAELTRMAGVVAMPKRKVTTLRQVEFLPLSERRVLVVLVVNRAEVQNRIIHTDKEYTEQALRQAANYINHHYAGQHLDDIKTALVQAMRSEKAHMSQLLATSVDVAEKALTTQKDNTGDYVLAGETNLLNMAEGDNMHRMRELFDAFSQKYDILHLLERSVSADGVQIFIGREAGIQVFEDYSLVSSPYAMEDGSVGVLAVVGPTRMDYEKVIPTVDITARLLSKALNKL